MKWRPRASRAARAYQAVFDYERDSVNAVLSDIRAAAYADETTFVEGDALSTAYNEGRRSLFLHIRDMLKLTDADIAEIEQWEMRQKMQEIHHD